MSPYSVIFCGTPTFALPSLQMLINDDAFAVTHVITQPDRPVGRKKNMSAPPIKELAVKHGINVWQPENINTEFESFVERIERPDFLVVVSFGQILSQQILDYPHLAPVNVHPSLLPKWRGASPYQSSILAGEDRTGVSIQRMVQKLDSGPLLHQIKEPLQTRETAISLHNRLANIGARLLVETLKHPLQETAQEEDLATYCKKFTREDGVVDPTTMTAEEIDRTVRALNPWPGVTCSVNGISVKLIETTLEETGESIPLECAHSTTLHISTLQEPGKKQMSGMEWKRGR